jgi:tetratricopeptide (TPR) repeat protein
VRTPVCLVVVWLTISAASAAAAQELTHALADRFSQGVAALKAGRLDAAEAAFRDVLRAGGERAFVHHNLGLVLRERGRHGEALGEFRAAAALDATFGPARLLAGTTLLALGRPREAIPELERAVQLLPREIAAHLELAEAYERTNDVVRLVDTYRVIAGLAPNEPEYAYRLGRAYLKLSEWAHARARARSPAPRSDEETRTRSDARADAGTDAAATNGFATGAALRVPESITGRAEIEQAIAARDWDRAERLLAAAIERAPESPGSRELLTLIARIFVLDRKPLNAAVAIKKAEALGPIDDQTRLTLALAYISMGRRDWARPELERLAASDASNVVYPYWLARLDYDAGQYASAIARLEDVVRRDRAFVRAYDNLGLCYEAQHQPDKAIAAYRDAIRLNRDPATKTKSAWPALNLGRLLRQRGDITEAEALFREAIRDDAQLAQAHYELGTLLEQQGPERDADALDALRRAAAANPAYAEPHYALSRIYRRQGKADQADAAMVAFRKLREGLDTNAAPTAAASVESLIDQARDAYKQRDFKGALGYLAHARDLDPKHAGVHFFFGIVCIELNLGSEAYESLKKAVALDPNNPFVNYALGAVAVHRHDSSEALPYFEAFVRLRPDDPRGRFALGAARFYSQQLDAARADLEQAARAPDTAAGAHYFLGRIARELNDLTIARRELDACLTINPQHADAWAELGLVQMRSSQLAEAEQSLAKALAIEPDHYAAAVTLATLYSRTRDPRREAQVERLATLQEKRAVEAQDFLRIIQVVP